MRISIDERESWTREQAEINRDCKVFLDGVEIKYCTVADEEQGYVERFKQNPQGGFVHNADYIEREELYGKVVIVSPYRRKQRG